PIKSESVGRGDAVPLSLNWQSTPKGLLNRISRDTLAPCHAIAARPRARQEGIAQKVVLRQRLPTSLCRSAAGIRIAWLALLVGVMTFAGMVWSEHRAE